MRLIDADALIKKRNHAKAYSPDMYVVGQGYVMDAPTIDAVSVVRGKWITSYGTCGFPINYKCSLCNKTSANGKTPYCPNCGAKMEVV